MYIFILAKNVSTFSAFLEAMLKKKMLVIFKGYA